MQGGSGLGVGYPREGCPWVWVVTSLEDVTPGYRKLFVSWGRRNEVHKESRGEPRSIHKECGRKSIARGEFVSPEVLKGGSGHNNPGR